MTLDEFLLARIAEDEVVAKDVPGTYDEKGLSWWGEYGHLSVSPARVLAECEAKRRIVELLAEDWRISREKLPPGLADHEPLLLRLLALPYTDHPDYREEWRP